MGDHILSTIKTFNPATFIGKGWKVLKAETDHRATALTQVDFSKVLLETCLKPNQSPITGKEKLKRLKEGGNIRLGSETFLALWTEKGRKTLKWLYKEKGTTYLDFFGTILESPDDHRYVLFLYRDGGWYWGGYWLGRDWSGRRYSASLAS